MKKLLFVFLSIMLVMGFAVSTATAQSGLFIGFSEADARGYTEARVILDDGEIIDVELIEFNDLAQPKGEEYPLDEFHEAMRELPERFKEANSHEVDAYSGATGTSDSAMEAVKMALDKAEGVTSFDGTFMGKSDVDERGNYGIAWVTVEEGSITDVRLEEVAGDEYKDEDYDWDEFHEAKEVMPGWFEEANDYDVDIYTGATGSAEKWIQAVIRALGKAGMQ